MKATDPQTGISVRFVREWKPEPKIVLSEADKALMLAMWDERSIPFAEKFNDAIEYLRSHPPVKA